MNCSGGKIQAQFITQSVSKFFSVHKKIWKNEQQMEVFFLKSGFELTEV